MLQRRDFIFAALSTGLCLSADNAISQVTSSQPDEDYQDFFSPDIPDLIAEGTDPATAPEVQKTFELMSKAPQGPTPLDVILYFEALMDKNIDNEFYNAGWRRRWNPVIVTFFQQTKTKPSGDTTAWCAASLNWFLYRAGYLGTSSASSGSFRSVPGRTDDPQRGDIVVFRRTNQSEANVGRGHVGLFLEHTNESIHVLGGNQKNDLGHHGICRKWIPKVSGALTFHSYHAVDALRAK